MRVKKKTGRIRLPRRTAGYNELADFFDRHDGTDLLDQGITEIDPDRADLDRMLREYWSQPNTKQLNIRIPPAAKRMIERLAKRKTVEVSTLVRMWVIDSMRREAAVERPTGLPACTTRQRGRNQKWRPERPPQAGGLPHEDSEQL
jgi:hypothetical protein